MTQVLGAGENEAPGPGVLVDETLKVGEEVRHALDLVQDGPFAVAAEERYRVIRGELAVRRVLEGLVGQVLDIILPVMTELTLGESGRRDFDAGRFVAYFLQLVGLISIGLMIAQVVVVRDFNLGGLIPIAGLFWGARGLKRHNETARRWTVGITGVLLAASLFFATDATLFGTEGWIIGSVGEVKDPPLWIALLSFGALGLVGGVPFFVLLSKRARQQFGGGAHQA